MSTNVLFLCPHAAAKSVFAMVYFEQLAKQAGLDVVVSNAGTEPDAAISPKVDAYLRGEGVVLTDFKPSLLSDARLDSADIVVSIGCISAESIPSNTRYLDWADVPQPSADLQRSRDEIYKRVAELVTDLTPST